MNAETRAEDRQRTSVSRRWVAAVAVVTVIACGPSKADEPSTLVTLDPTEPHRLALDADPDAPTVAFVKIGPLAVDNRYPLDNLRLLLASPDRDTYLDEILPPPRGPSSYSSLSGGEPGADRKALPASIGHGPNGCTAVTLGALDLDGQILEVLAEGMCGAINTSVQIQWTSDGFRIADQRFFDDPPPPSPPGTIALDRRGHRRLPPGEPLDIDLTILEQALVRPEGDNILLPEQVALPPVVCVDVTVTSGAGVPFDPLTSTTTTLKANAEDWERTALQPRPQVVPDIALTQRGERIPLTEPTSGSGVVKGPRVLTQDEHLTVTWSYGPLPLDQFQPDQITVTAAQGQIVDWGASIRHC